MVYLNYRKLDLHLVIVGFGCTIIKLDKFMMISSIFEEGGCTIESWTGGDLAGASLPSVSGSWNEHELQNACHTEQQGCISCGPCSCPELTEDRVLPSAYVEIFRTVTRNAVNKSF